jgi:hypothetical protein
MRAICRAIAITAVAATGIAILPATAQATPHAGRPSGTTAAAFPPASDGPDGKLWLYRDTERADPFRLSLCAKYLYDSPDWGACSNQISSLWNNGYPGNLDDVWLYWGANYTGARRGVYNGGYLPDLAPYTFDARTGTGAGQSINNNVASHRWTNLP